MTVMPQTKLSTATNTGGVRGHNKDKRDERYSGLSGQRKEWKVPQTTRIKNSMPDNTEKVAYEARPALAKRAVTNGGASR